MRPCVDVAPCLEVGTLRASANFQDPDVRLNSDEAEAPSILVEEGGVTVVLEFPDLGAVRRFLRRLATLEPNTHRSASRAHSGGRQ